MDLLKENIRLLRSSQTSSSSGSGRSSGISASPYFHLNECSTMKCIIEPLILFTGLVSNLIMVMVILRNRRTEGLVSDKPMRYLLLAILLSDMWFLVDHINVWYFTMQNKPDLSSYNGACQIYTYMEYLFSTSIELYMISADLILLDVVRKSRRNKSQSPSDEVYTENLIDSGGGGGGVTESTENRKSLAKSERFSMYSMQDNNNQIQQIALAAASTNAAHRFGSSSYSRNSNDDSTTMVCSNKNRSRFVRMIQSHTSQFKSENIYLNIVFREKVILILCTFLCVYLLSFLLWIRGNDHQITKSTSINMESALQQVLSISSKDSYSLPPPANTNNNASSMSVFHSKKSSLVDLSGEWSNKLESLELSLVPVCLTYEFAVPLIRIFISMTSVLRGLTLVINLVMSSYFLFTFRTEYLYTMRNMFKRNHEILPGGDVDSSNDVESTGYGDGSSSSAESSSENKSIKLFNNLSLVYSANEPFTVEIDETVAAARTSNATTVAQVSAQAITRARKYYRSHFSHFHFVRHYAIMTLFYSLLIAPSVLHDNKKLAGKIFETLLSTTTSTAKSGSDQSQSKEPIIGGGGAGGGILPSILAKNTFTLLSASNKKKNESELVFSAASSSVYEPTSPKSPVVNEFNAIKKSNDLLVLDTITNIFEPPSSEDQDSELYDNFLHMTKCLAHSTKLLTYMLFSVHLKLNFKCRKKNYSYGEASLL